MRDERGHGVVAVEKGVGCRQREREECGGRSRKLEKKDRWIGCRRL